MFTKLFGCITDKGEEGSTVYLSGEIDYAASLELVPKLDDIMEDCRGDLLFDLAGVTLIDSEGIKMLLEAVERMRGRQALSGVVRASKMADRIMKLLGVCELLGAGDNVDPTLTTPLARRFPNVESIPHA